jgi:hypothetical protein
MHNKPNHRPCSPRPTAPRSGTGAIPLTIRDYAAEWVAPSVTPAEYLGRRDRLLSCEIRRG